MSYITDFELVEVINGNDYDFLRENKHLGGNIMLLGLGGSYAYGTNIEGSDLDIRGVALNSKSEILLGRDFEQVCNNVTDTTIYSFKKIIELLRGCNPNTIEILGLKPEHYLCISKEGKLLLDNKDLFLSQRAAYTFGGYANQQLRRLENCSSHRAEQDRQEEHLLKSLQRVKESIVEKGFVDAETVRLYTDKSDKKDMQSEIFFDASLSHCSLRDFGAMYGELSNVVREYSKMGARNSKALEHGKLAKHSMHLVRLYYMCFDILEKGEIHTYRENEHDLLMDIRNGKYIDENNQPVPEFFEMINELENRLDYDKKNTFLPIKPNNKLIDEFVMDINNGIIKRTEKRCIANE